MHGPGGGVLAPVRSALSESDRAEPFYTRPLYQSEEQKDSSGCLISESSGCLISESSGCLISESSDCLSQGTRIGQTAVPDHVIFTPIGLPHIRHGASERGRTAAGSEAAPVCTAMGRGPAARLRSGPKPLLVSSFHGPALGRADGPKPLSAV